MNRSLLVLLVALLLPSLASAHPSAQHRIEVLTESIREKPDDPLRYMQRGQAYSNEGMLEAALADFRKAEALGDPVLVAFDLGVLHYRMGKLDAARRDLDRYIARFPRHAQALEYRARVRRDAGDHAGAVADFNAYFALQKQPNPGDYVSAAQMLSSLPEEGVSSALAMLDRGIARLGVIPQLQQPAIELERRRGNTAQAIARLETLEPALGDSPDWKVDMGELLLLDGRSDEARAYFDAAAAQLASQRVTAARKRVRDRLEKLQASLEEAPS
jgi:tetratricopeptide (TPR) repeat protein